MTPQVFFRADQQQQRLEWGSEGERNYSGWLAVQATGNSTSEVTVHLSFARQNHALQEMDKRVGNHEQAINEGIQNALLSIKNHCEGRGGKVESDKQK